MPAKAVVPYSKIDLGARVAGHELQTRGAGDFLSGLRDRHLDWERAYSSIGSSLYSSAAFGDVTNSIERRIAALKNPPAPSSVTYVVQDTSIEERLFDAAAAAKILTSQVAMHLESEWRQKLFRQLDSLHDPEEWESGDLPLQQSSFATFLKAICQIKPKKRPGLGLSGGGHLIAAWATKRDRLTIEFLPSDGVRWVLSRHHDDEVERFAGQTKVARLLEGLAPYQPEFWFSYEKDTGEGSP